MALHTHKTRILSRIGKELKKNPPKILAKTRRKKGKTAALAQKRAILLSKARRGRIRKA